MSETHIHLHIPAGYQLALIGDRLTIAPITNVRENARALAADPAAATAAVRAVRRNTRGKGISVVGIDSATLQKQLREMSERIERGIRDGLRRGTLR